VVLAKDEAGEAVAGVARETEAKARYRMGTRAFKAESFAYREGRRANHPARLLDFSASFI
jgi:hypothetical protein